MRKRRYVILLLVLAVLFVSASFADSDPVETKLAGMLASGMSMTDVVVSLEDEPETQAFLAQCGNDTLAFLEVLCDRELGRRGVRHDHDESDRMTYVVNTNTDKFHLPYCRSVEDIKEKNRWDFVGSREELIRFKYVPCKNCNP